MTSDRSPRSLDWSGPPALILCPGGYDRQLPVPGWDLPGVMAAGGVQAMLKGYGTLAGRRAVVAGTGPFLLPVAAGLAAAGAEVVGICEAAAVTSWLPQLGGALQVPSKGIDAAGIRRPTRPAPDSLLDPVSGDHDQRGRSGPQRHHRQGRQRRAREARHAAVRSVSTWSPWAGVSRPPWSWWLRSAAAPASMSTDPWSRWSTIDSAPRSPVCMPPGRSPGWGRLARGAGRRAGRAHRRARLRSPRRCRPGAAACSAPSPARAPSRRRCTEPIRYPATGTNGSPAQPWCVAARRSATARFVTLATSWAPRTRGP